MEKEGKIGQTLKRRGDSAAAAVHKIGDTDPLVTTAIVPNLELQRQQLVLLVQTRVAAVVVISTSCFSMRNQTPKTPSMLPNHFKTFQHHFESKKHILQSTKILSKPHNQV